MIKRDQLNQEHVRAAHEVYASDNLMDIHNLLFVEMAILLQSRGKAAELTWQAIRFEESAIVFEKHESETRDFEEIYEASRRGIKLDYLKNERWVETGRFALSPEHIQLLTLWSDKIQEFRTAKGIEDYKRVFCSFYSKNKPSVYESTYNDTRSLRNMSNSEPKQIIDRCVQWIAENRLKDHPRADEIRQRLIEIEDERASLQRELDQLSQGINPLIEVHKSRDISLEELRDAYGFWSLRDDRGGLEKLYAAGVRSRQAIEDWLTNPFPIKGIGAKGIEAIRIGLKLADQEKKGDDYAKGIEAGINPIPTGARCKISMEFIEAQLPYEFDWSPTGTVVEDYPPCPDLVSIRIEQRNGQALFVEVPFISLRYWHLHGDVLDKLFPIEEALIEHPART